MQNDPNMPVKGRIDSLQGVRAMAFLGIYLYHAIKSFSGDGIVYTFFSTGPGPWGVSVFFVLSGFLMTYSYWNRSPETTLKGMAVFAAHKVKKLYPLHLVMLFFGSVYLLLGHESAAVILKRLIITVPLLQTWSPADYQAINSVAWYLSVSLFLYFLFPRILRSIKHQGASNRAVMLIAVYALQMIIGYCAARFTHVGVKWITYCHPLYRTGDFVIGGLTASFFMNRQRSSSPSTVCGSILEILALVCSFAVCAFYSRISAGASWFAYTCLFTPASVMLVYVFSRNSGSISRAMNNKVIFWLADISPYGFLIHRMAVYYYRVFTVRILHWERTGFVLVVAVPFLITVIAIYGYLAVEKKMTGMLRKRDAQIR